MLAEEFPLSFVNTKFTFVILFITPGFIPKCHFTGAITISGYMLGVNPFNQPGVEAYKKNMFALLGKPGYENMKAELEARLG